MCPAAVTLVLGLAGNTVSAWFIGPVGAGTDQMVLAAPRRDDAAAPLALMDAADPAWDSGRWSWSPGPATTSAW